MVIIFYFECCFLPARAGSLPQGRQPNLCQHLTRFNSTTKRKNRHQPVIHPWVLEQVFGEEMPFHTNQFGLGVMWTWRLDSLTILLPVTHICINFSSLQWLERRTKSMNTLSATSENWKKHGFLIGFMYHHHHHLFNVDFLPRLIKGMDYCFPTAYGRPPTFSDNSILESPE